MPSVVFDAVIFIRALINPDGRWGQLIFTYAERYRMVISQPMLMEILEVMTRSHISRKYRGMATRNIQVVLALLSQADIVELDAIPAVCRDPNDDMILATAVAAAADYIVSEDRDVLDIGLHEGVRIVTTITFLALLRGEADEE